MIFLKLILAIFLFSNNLQANVHGGMDTFSPNTDGIDFITVHSARPLEKGTISVSNYISYAKNPLFVYKDLLNQTIMDYSSYFLEYNLGASYALTDTIQLNFRMPYTLEYGSDMQDGIRVDVIKGVHSYRPGVKWTAFDDGSNMFAALLSIDFPEVINSPYMGIDPDPILNIEFAYTKALSNSAHALNLGYRVRNPSRMPADARMFPIDDQLTASYGYVQGIFPSTQLIFELFGSYPIKNDGVYKEPIDATSLDALLGLRHLFWDNNLKLDYGATVSPLENQSADWRVFAGLVFYWKPKFSDDSNRSQARPQPTREYISRVGEEVSDSLMVIPEKEEIYENATLQFEVVGGLAPYSYRVVKGGGRISETGLYKAPARPSNVILEVSDSLGLTQTMFVTVKEIPKADKTISLSNVNFQFGKDVLNPSSKKDLEKNLRTLKGMSITQIIVEGHTDSIGTKEYNYNLSEKRAQAIRSVILNTLDLEPKSVKAIGHGPDKPITTNKTPEGRKLNRRVALKVYFKK